MRVYTRHLVLQLIYRESLQLYDIHINNLI